MAGVHGEHMYGYVDRVPGLCYVSTRFFHINFVPLIPLGSFVVLEGTEAEQGFQGKRIGFNAKSVLLGYFRGWVGLAVIVLFGYCAIQAGEIWSDGADALTRGLVICGLVAWYGCVWWALIASHKSWLIGWLLVLAGSAGYFAWDHENPPPQKPANFNPFRAAPPKVQQHREELPTVLLYANGCLFALSVLRTFDKAGRSRAYALGELLGVGDEQMDAIWEKATGQPIPDEYAEPSS
ncbi:hypothetical protein [Limnoglobus roseus]|uniref:Uncharacterized protein n=1 Tax=Limnoglobus roseus TaxID=2598579 RepID=A0A5C1A991_9BACT|nr:hypothetical protein [Limnoglobus roseus]QEL15290.1 hypothetical protein PX52LOC_02205 [Limnoglobus roseus]